MVDRVRRVVMGEPASGPSRFTHVEEVQPLGAGGARFVWGWDEVPTLPHADDRPYEPRSFFPPPGGLRIIAMGFSPGDGGEVSAEAQEQSARLMAAEPAGMKPDPSRPGMHRTDTIDIGVIVSGEVTTEADDGSKVVLGP